VPSHSSTAWARFPSISVAVFRISSISLSSSSNCAICMLLSSSAQYPRRPSVKSPKLATTVGPKFALSRWRLAAYPPLTNTEVNGKSKSIPAGRLSLSHRLNSFRICG